MTSYVRLLLAPLVASATLAPPHSHVLTPLKVQKIPKSFYGYEDFFDKYIPVLSSPYDGSKGVQVVASKGTPDDKVERVANVLAEFLDNDEDGWVDNPDVVLELEKRGATMIMFASADEHEKSGFDSVPGYDDQSVEGDETAGNNTFHAHLMLADDCERSACLCKYRPDLKCDAPLEEVFHLVTDSGYSHVYPQLFGYTGSAMTTSMDGLIRDCGYASIANPFGRYTIFRYPNCTGMYHYSDDTCDYRCLAVEYIHHVIASYNGEYPWNERCGSDDERAEEWELCRNAPDGNLSENRELLKRLDPDFFALFTDPYFRLPLRMPDGNYTPLYEPPSEMLLAAKASAGSVSGGKFGRIVLQGSVRRAHRKRLVARETQKAMADKLLTV